MTRKYNLPPGALEAWAHWDREKKVTTYYSSPPLGINTSRCAVLPVGKFLYKIGLMNVSQNWSGPPLLLRAATVGFAFSSDLKQVVLIRKSRPAWQSGLLNGVGGKVENEETIRHCVAREFAEETGPFVPTERWHLYRRDIFKESKNQVYFFTVVLTDEELASVSTRTDEEVLVIPVADLASRTDLVYNLPFLIPEALSWLNFPEHHYVV